MTQRATWFQRLLLPAFAFKAVVIGGGYATGRELAEYFLPAGPRQGLLGMALSAAIWSVVCVATFLFAQTTGSTDYRGFFGHLLGRVAPAFEACYFAFALVALSVFGAAAGAIFHSVLGAPPIVGTLALVASIAGVAAFGGDAVERLFKYVSILLYATYALFLALCIWRFGNRIADAFGPAAPPGGASAWLSGGVTYAGYNVVGAVVILPVLRHVTTRRDAVWAGLLCGPLAMLPAVLFFVCMAAWYPGIASAALPSDALLLELRLPVFRLVFQAMIFAALLESGTGMVHAVNERVAHRWPAAAPRTMRFGLSLLILLVATVIARRFGLVALIAHGYRALAWAFLGIYVVPLLTLGVWRLHRGHALSMAAA